VLVTRVVGVILAAVLVTRVVGVVGWALFDVGSCTLSDVGNTPAEFRMDVRNGEEPL
jgi:hypothetical protein